MAPSAGAVLSALRRMEDGGGREMSANKAIRRLVKRIEELKDVITDREADIDQLEYDLNSAQEQAYYVEQSACREKTRLRNELNRERSECDSRRWERESIVKDIERCRDWGDSYGVERGLSKLRRM